MYITLFLSYFLLLLIVSRLTSKRNDSDEAFFSANRSSSWLVVAFGMIGASVSGISVVSVPGMVGASAWTYLQTCLGFFFGYVAVAYILLPLYYRLRLTSIYEYLYNRFGVRSRLVGSMLFIVAKLVSSATKLYVAVLVLQRLIFDNYNIPFVVTVSLSVLVIWLYTYRSGIKTIVRTDFLQTFFMIAAVIIISVELYNMLDLDFKTLTGKLVAADHTRIFVFDDWMSTRNFWKQFVSGIFIVIVMTGLDQDMMQKNLTCRTLSQSRKNMLSYGAAFVPVNLLLLLIGSMILIYADFNSVALPHKPDDIMPFFVTNMMSPLAGCCFALGIMAATFSSADSALTSITTSLSIDVLNVKSMGARRRTLLHAVVCMVFAVIVVSLDYFGNKSLIDTIYTIVGYAYGPLLGLFAFGLLTKRRPVDKFVPVPALISPLLCYAIDMLTVRLWNYHFGYELLMLNGLMTFFGLWLIPEKTENIDSNEVGIQ